jgi:hypothetical protein
MLFICETSLSLGLSSNQILMKFSNDEWLVEEAMCKLTTESDQII